MADNNTKSAPTYNPDHKNIIGTTTAFVKVEGDVHQFTMKCCFDLDSSALFFYMDVGEGFNLLFSQSL